ncbi:MAG: DUF1446 domain-containing protein [Candidatus Brevundimonas colombiensis]|uniref:DUF1446 domain-containing protein n=1 Tax=Candidatus Brevundimonas colombiensis TaxID=3121376 RepID=A0AAJ5X2Y0_9CAUL|nr:acyclic terpene utilization AtuA family protein [Brevundimonas sp.]WEK41455.1 MAG: DUF1446 domain-containing protein [Brevundimonas sp.]
MREGLYETLRIGSGAGFAEDRIDPAVDLAMHGRLDVLVFECLAERTIAQAVAARRLDDASGFDPLLDERIGEVLAHCVRNHVTIVSNMGAANPAGAARRVADIARRLGLKGLKIAAVQGDDVSDRLESLQPFTDEGLPYEQPISANAYVGHQGIVEALRDGADVVLTGRTADPSLFLAPMAYAFGWDEDDWERLGRGTAIGHLLECAGQLTGGYFADPGVKDVPNLAGLGFPIAEVRSDGTAVFSKLEGSGGRLSVATCTEQLLYELHDPSAYLTPDVTADFSSIRFEDLGEDRVALSGGGGRERPRRLKVSVGIDEGWLGEGQISYAGPGCVARGHLALAIVDERLSLTGVEVLDARFDLIGIDAVSRSSDGDREPYEVRARVACRVRTEAEARRVGREVAGLYTNGPAGGGGAASTVKAVVGIVSALIDRDRVVTSLTWEIS